MRMKSTLQLGIACITLTGLLAGCSSGTSPSNAGNSANNGKATTQQGGAVVEALPALAGINWYLPLRPNAYNTVYNDWAASLMYKGLFTIGSDGNIDFSRSVAQSIDWNKDGTVYTVKLNPKWHWSNGQPVTANDVQFTWNLIKAASSKTAPAPWPYAGDGSGGIPDMIKSFQVINPLEFQITLTKPVNQQWFEYDGLADFVPLPVSAWNKYPNDINAELSYLASNANNPGFFNVIDGPFQMVSAVQNVGWKFTPNPKYNGHKATISSFTLAYQTSDTSEVSALRKGAVQIGYLPAYMYGSRSQLTNDNLTPYYNFSMTITRMDFKNKDVGSIFNQLRVRQALEMGIDQASIIKDLYNSLGSPGTGPVPQHPSTFLAPQLTKPLYNFDPAAGKQLLEKNGWHEVNGVMQNAQGQQLSFVDQYVAGNATTQTLVQLLQQDWAQEGIKVTLDPLPFATMVQYHSDPSKWELQTGISWNYGGEYPSGDGIYASTGGYNFFGYSDSHMDQLILATQQPHATTAEAQQALDDYQTYAAQQLPNLWMPSAESLAEVSKTVNGYQQFFNPFTGSISPQYLSLNN